MKTVSPPEAEAYRRVAQAFDRFSCFRRLAAPLDKRLWLLNKKFPDDAVDRDAGRVMTVKRITVLLRAEKHLRIFILTSPARWTPTT